MRNKVMIPLLFLMLCAFLCDAAQAVDEAAFAQFDSLPTEYVIAVDQSDSVSGTYVQRNEAIVSLVNGLPYDATHCALLYFTYEEKWGEDEKLSEMMDMSVQQNRDDLIKKAQGSEGSYQEPIDLAEMMRVALSKFSDYDSDRQSLGTSVRHIIYVITDGKGGDAKDQNANKRSQEDFESLCRKYAELGDLYIIYVSGDEQWLSELCDGLGTMPVTIDETENGAEFRNRLTRREPGESAKVLSIENFDSLETALMNLRYADADEIINRTRSESGAVSFVIPPLGVKELSIALSGGKRVTETLEHLSRLNDKFDLLQAVQTENDSVITIPSKLGLPAGEYRMNVITNSPVSLVIAMRYGFRTDYHLDGLEKNGTLPVNMPIPLRMELFNPDGSLIKDDVPLSMKVYRQGETGDWIELLSAPNGTLLRLTEENENLRFVPVVNGREQETFWNVRAQFLPLELSSKTFSVSSFWPGRKILFLANVSDALNGPFFPSRDVQFSVSNANGDIALTKIKEGKRETLYVELDMKLFAQPYDFLVKVTDAAKQVSEASWRVYTHVGFQDFSLWALVLLALALLAGKVRKKRKEKLERQAQEAAENELRRRKEKEKQAYEQYLQPNDKLFIRAGLSCKITMKSGEIMMGALGLTNQRGKPRRGCLIRDIPMYCLNDDKRIIACSNPLPFGLWRHNPNFRRTELIFPETENIRSFDADGDEPTQIVPCCPVTIPSLLQKQNIDSASAQLFIYSVSDMETQGRFRSVTLETPDLRADFFLEYYTTRPPFYWSERERCN